MRSRLLLLGLIASAAIAQAQPAAKKGVTVTGHVYCADTNAPARLATVALEPAAAVETPPATDKRFSPGNTISFTAVQTGLDGSFAIPDVVPGDYYVVAEKPGYISPFARLGLDSLKDASPERRKDLLRSLPRISVQSGLPATVDVRLERGGAITGTVLFDDGAPAAGLPVHVLTRKRVGQAQGDKAVWTPVRSSPLPMMSEVSTDDQGRYRMVGLFPDDYLVEVDLQINHFEFSMSPGHEGGSTSFQDDAKLAFYSGGTTRKRDAKPLKLGAGDEAGEDLVIPLSKLHTVSGELTAAHDGHVLNHGDIQVLDPDDKSVLESTKVLRPDQRFSLRFVPEGDYILHVEGAADVTYEDVSNGPDVTPRTHEEVHTLHSYGSADQRLSVHEDMSGLNVAVPDKGSTR